MLLYIFLLALIISVDAFSLSVIYGTIGIRKERIITLAITVGIFHLVMPLLGATMGKIIGQYVDLNNVILTFVLFMLLGINMIYESFQSKTDLKDLKGMEMFAFALAVSLDSFALGFWLKALNYPLIICSLIFLIVSATITYLGLILGNQIGKKVGKRATLISGIIFLFLAFKSII